MLGTYGVSDISSVGVVYIGALKDRLEHPFQPVLASDEGRPTIPGAVPTVQVA
jgi:hypothetical protein